MIYVECKPDGALVRSVTGLAIRDVIHENGKYAVCKRISDREDCKGMVDEDPTSRQAAYLTRITLSQDLPQYGLKVFTDTPKNNRIVVLCPKLEDWILKAAGEIGLNVEDRKYNLPNHPRRLHQVINADARKIERLLEDLIVAGSDRLGNLGRLLS